VFYNLTLYISKRSEWILPFELPPICRYFRGLSSSLLTWSPCKILKRILVSLLSYPSVYIATPFPIQRLLLGQWDAPRLLHTRVWLNSGVDFCDLLFCPVPLRATRSWCPSGAVRLCTFLRVRSARYVFSAWINCHHAIEQLFEGQSANGRMKEWLM
jgi:hypothetical protein